MIAPRYIKDGLKAIDKMYFAVFNPRITERKNMSLGRGRWQIRKWTGNIPKRFDLWNCYGYSETIMTICKEEMTDDGLVDAGYEEMDARVLHAFSRSNHWKNNWKEKIAEMDWRNERRRRSAESQIDYESRYAAKRAWRSMHEPTVHLSGKDWVR